MRRNPRVTLLCYDPRRPLRYLEIRGTVVEITERGASQHLDALASKDNGPVPGIHLEQLTPLELAHTGSRDSVGG